MACFLCCQVAFLDFSVIVGFFIIRLSQITSFFSWHTCSTTNVRTPFNVTARLRPRTLDRNIDFIKWRLLQQRDQCWRFKTRLLLRCIHNFKSDFINNIDHMRISGIEPSSVILSQTSSFKNWNEMSKSAKTRSRRTTLYH